jgi:hypothetical protein
VNDQKSIFGILVGLVALFAFWLWATGRFATLVTAMGGTNPVGTSSAATSTNGDAGAPAAASRTSQSVAIPNYANTTAAAQSLSLSTPYGLGLGGASSLGGYTVNGAMSGGVSVTPSVFANTFSIPKPVSSSGGNDWLSELFGAQTTSVGPATGSAGVGGNDAANIVGGNSAPLG